MIEIVFYDYIVLMLVYRIKIHVNFNYNKYYLIFYKYQKLTFYSYYNEFN